MEADYAAQQGDVPVGAVAVCGDELLAKAHNVREANHDPLGHAEIVLLRRLSQEHFGWRMSDVTIYVTCEPCLMCMGALIQARIPKLVFGCYEPKTGACGSLYNLSNDKRLNHQIEVVGGVLHDECAMQMRTFFQNIRNGKEVGVEGH